MTTVPLPRVARCHAPTNSANNASDTIAARKVSEEVMACAYLAH